MLIAFILWFSIIILYLFNPYKTIALYFILLPFFPFYWTPIYIVPFNALNVQRFIAIGIMGGIILHAFSNIKKHTNQFNLHLGYFLFLICIIWHISLFEFTTFSNWIRMIVFSILDFWFPFYAGMLIAKEGKVKPILKCIVWSTSIVGVFIFYEFFTQQPIVYHWFERLPTASVASPPEFWGFSPTFRSGMLRAQAGLAQPIFAGFYLACGALIAFILSKTQKGSNSIVYYSIGIFLLIASLLPMARGAFIGFIFAVFIFTLLLKNVRGWRMVFLWGGTGGLIWGASQYWEGAKTFWTNFVLTIIGKASVNVQSEQLVNWEGRIEMLRKGIDLLVKAPVFGYGDISFGGAWIIRDICNVFMQVSLQAGIPGLLLLMIFLILIGIQGFQLWRREKDNKNTVLVAGIIGCYFLVLASWMGASWPGQFTQLGWFILGVLHGMNLSKWPRILSEYRSYSNNWDTLNSNVVPTHK